MLVRCGMHNAAPWFLLRAFLLFLKVWRLCCSRRFRSGGGGGTPNGIASFFALSLFLQSTCTELRQRRQSHFLAHQVAYGSGKLTQVELWHVSDTILLSILVFVSSKCICLSVYLFICLSVYLFICMCVFYVVCDVM
jgi:hypothetical protein